MIVGFFLSFVLLVVNAFIFMLTPFGLVVPAQISLGFIWIFSYVHVADGFFPMNDVLLAILSVMSVWFIVYMVRVALFVFSLIPIIGKAVSLPKMPRNRRSSR